MIWQSYSTKQKEKEDQKGIVWMRNCHVEWECCYGAKIMWNWKGDGQKEILKEVMEWRRNYRGLFLNEVLEE